MGPFAPMPRIIGRAATLAEPKLIAQPNPLWRPVYIMSPARARRSICLGKMNLRIWWEVVLDALNRGPPLLPKGRGACGS